MLNETIDNAIKELDDARKRIDELVRMTVDKPLDHSDWNEVNDIRWYYDGLVDMLNTIVAYEFGIDYCVVYDEETEKHKIVGSTEME